jgi:hypothetical protein
MRKWWALFDKAQSREAPKWFTLGMAIIILDDIAVTFCRPHWVFDWVWCIGVAAVYVGFWVEYWERMRRKTWSK